MRILVVPKDFPSKREPYAGIFILRRIQALRELGHDISVFRIVPAAPPFGEKWNAYRSIPRDETIDGFPVRAVRAVIPPRMIGMEYVPWSLRGALEAEIKRTRAELVHASFLIPCGQLATRQRLVPSIVTSHGIDAHKWPKLRPGLWRASKEAVEKASRVTAVSAFIAERLSELSPRSVCVIWNGADERFFYPRDRAPARLALDLPPDRKILGFAGNILRVKGLFDLVDALNRIPRERRPLLAIGGVGPDAKELERAAQHAGVEMRLLGRLDSNGVATLFAASDVVTLPSYAEGLPNVVCEAMLSQRAVVASTAGGTPEIVTHGRTGLLVTPGDPAELAAALSRAFENDSLRDALALEARSFAVQNLTWRISAKKYEELYREVLEPSDRIPRADRSHIPSAAR